MENNSQNKDTGWAKRLGAFDRIQNDYTNREENWLRLTERLAEPTEKKRVYRWYWAAAAAVVVLCAVRILSLEKKQPVRMDGSSASKSQETMIKKIQPIDTTRMNIPVVTKTGGTTIKIRHADLPLKKTPAPDSKKEQSLPVVPGALQDLVIDSPIVEQEPEFIPTFHMNDFNGKEPLPKNITIKSLQVQKMIRLGVDMTGGNTPKMTDKIPGNKSTLSQNQN